MTPLLPEFGPKFTRNLGSRMRAFIVEAICTTTWLAKSRHSGGVSNLHNQSSEGVSNFDNQSWKGVPNFDYQSWNLVKPGRIVVHIRRRDIWLKGSCLLNLTRGCPHGSRKIPLPMTAWSQPNLALRDEKALRLLIKYLFGLDDVRALFDPGTGDFERR